MHLFWNHVVQVVQQQRFGKLRQLGEPNSSVRGGSGSCLTVRTRRESAGAQFVPHTQGMHVAQQLPLSSRRSRGRSSSRNCRYHAAPRRQQHRSRLGIVRATAAPRAQRKHMLEQAARKHDGSAWRRRAAYRRAVSSSSSASTTPQVKIADGVVLRTRSTFPPGRGARREVSANRFAVVQPPRCGCDLRPVLEDLTSPCLTNRPVKVSAWCR